MEAIDTVMDKDEMIVCSLVSKYPFGSIENVIRETAIHQVEISFPKGEKQVIDKGRKSMLEDIEAGRVEIGDVIDSMCQESIMAAHKEGRKEVVEWFRQHYGFHHMAVYDNWIEHHLLSDDNDFQAQLKEWGL